MTNIIRLADSYKYSHAGQYPAMVSMYDYMESRGGKYDSTVFVGLQYYLKEFISNVPTKEDVIKAERKAALHGIPFDREGWDYIVELGHIPVTVKAVAEGSVIPVKHALVTIESTDPRVPWAAGFLETLLMKVWYPTNIATKSYHVKKMLENYGSPEWAMFAYHNFGDRGSSSVESAAIGGYAHLTQFMGTDNFNSLFFCEDYYNVPEDQVAGYSVFATEHSSVCSHGVDGEEQFVYDMLMANPDAPIMSFVADSYDVYKFTDFCTNPEGRIRKLIDSRPHQKFVLRPDSGEPIEVISQMVQIMNNNNLFVEMGDTGKFIAPSFGILWGDGITPETIESILKFFCTETDVPMAAENFVFGSGGDLMQAHDRDTQRFAVKCSSIDVFSQSTSPDFPDEIHSIDVFKDPITDPGKASKRGKVTTWFDTETKEYIAGHVGKQPNMHCVDALVEVFKDGKLLVDYSLEEIRSRS